MSCSFGQEVHFGQRRTRDGRAGGIASAIPGRDILPNRKMSCSFGQEVYFGQEVHFGQR